MEAFTLLESNDLKLVRPPIPASTAVGAGKNVKKHPDVNVMKIGSLSNWKLQIAFGAAFAVLLDRRGALLPQHGPSR